MVLYLRRRRRPEVLVALSREERLAQRRAYNKSPAGKAARARWLAKPENQAKQNERSRAWYHANKDRSRARQRAAHGVVAAPGEQLEPGACPVCLRVRSLVLDHDYDTGAIRGWLCRQCNGFIGRTRDEARDRAARVLAYIQGAP